MSRVGNLGAALYRGEVSFDIVGRYRRWYAISLLILVVSLGSLALKGLTLGVEFRGGAEFIVSSPTATVERARSVVSDLGVGSEPLVQAVGNSRIRVQTPELSQAKADEVQSALASALGVKVDDIQTQRIGPTWGGEISRKAFTGLLVFLVLVALYLSVTYEWKMAVAALGALLHDLLITTGIYSLVGFEVTPATIIGLLTILGYSLYDTVVIFDKIKENTAGLAGGSRMTYSQASNLALNQTLVRSINTSITALLPVAGLLFIGAGLLGAGTLKDLALVLFVGMAAGTYSSIFIATPILAQLREREPAMKALAKRVAARQSGGTARQPSVAAAGPGSAPVTSARADVPRAGEPAAARAARSSVPRKAQPRRPGGKPGRPSGKKKRR